MLYKRCYRKIGLFYDSVEWLWDIRFLFAWLINREIFKWTQSAVNSIIFAFLESHAMILHVRQSIVRKPFILQPSTLKQNLKARGVSKVASSSLGENFRRFCCQSTYSPGRGNEVWKLLGHFVSAPGSGYDGADCEGTRPVSHVRTAITYGHEARNSVQKSRRK